MNYPGVGNLTVRYSRARADMVHMPQPESSGIPFDVLTPNRLQPMPGEYVRGREMPGDFFPRVEPVRQLSAHLGVPFWADSILSGAGLRPAAYADAGGDRGAFLPHFAAGGDLPPGATGEVGEQGPEVVHANAGGGVTVTPMTKPPAPAYHALPSGGLPGRLAAAATAPVAAAPQLSGAAATPTLAPPTFGDQARFGPPPERHQERDAYDAALAKLSGMGGAPEQVEPSRGRRVAAVLAGLGAGFVGGPAAGLDWYREIADAPQRAADQRWRRAWDAAANEAGALEPAASEEERENRDALTAYDAARRAADSRQASAERNEMEAERLADEQTRLEAEAWARAHPAPTAPRLTATDQGYVYWTPGGYQVAEVGGKPLRPVARQETAGAQARDARAAARAAGAAATRREEAVLATYPDRASAEAALTAAAPKLAAAGVSVASLQAAVDRRWGAGAQKAAPGSEDLAARILKLAGDGQAASAANAAPSLARRMGWP